MFHLRGQLKNAIVSALVCVVALVVGSAAPAFAGTAGRRHSRSGDGHHADTVCSSTAARAHHRARQAAHCVRTHRTHPPKRTKVKSVHTHARPTSPTAPANSTLATTSPPAVSSPAATIATVLATTCENTQLIPSAQNLALVRASVLCLINHERAENGVAPLKANAELEQAAEGHCSELIEDDYFAHVSPSGLTPVERIEQTGYVPSPSVGYVIGENLAWGTYELATPQSIVAAWIASPEHLANILEAQYRETGVGVTPAVPSSLSGGAPGATYAQEFGVIIP